jgi:2-oxoglutarate ferredoxin oxidoreductase subunit delta
MAHITINAEGCKACMLCADFCPRECIATSDEMNSRGFHPATFVHPERCTGCRICATMCPDVCIEVFREERTPSTSSSS